MNYLTIILSVLPILISAKPKKLRGWPFPVCDSKDGPNKFSEEFKKAFNQQHREVELKYNCELAGRVKQILRGRPIDKSEGGLDVIRDIHEGNFTKAELAKEVVENSQNAKLFAKIKHGTEFGCASVQEQIKQEVEIRKGLCWLYWKVSKNSWMLKRHEKRKLRSLRPRCTKNKKIDQATVICFFNQTRDVENELGNEAWTVQSLSKALSITSWRLKRNEKKKLKSLRPLCLKKKIDQPTVNCSSNHTEGVGNGLGYEQDVVVL